MTATTKGSKGTRVALMAWHRRLGHLSFGMVERGASGMVITDLPVRIPSLGVCAACVAEMSVHLSHKEDRGKACKHQFCLLQEAKRKSGMRSEGVGWWL